MTSIARENNVSVNTVQRVLGSCSHRFLDSYEYLPAHLAFDCMISKIFNRSKYIKTSIRIDLAWSLN